MPKTLAEIAIEAGLVTKASAGKAGRLADRRKEPLVVTLIKDLGVDEVALLGAIRKQTRIPLIDPASVPLETEALRLVPREICLRLRVLPLAVHVDGTTTVLRVAMADPTDASAIAELEARTRCEIDVHALPLSAIDELIDRGYHGGHTATVGPRSGGTMFITSKGSLRGGNIETESEVSVTAQIPLSALQQAVGTSDLEARLSALVSLLLSKGLITEAEWAEALRASRPKS